MRQRHYFVGVVLAFLLVPHLANAQTFFTARLTTAQENHDVTSDATGTAALALTAEGARFFVSVDGLSGAIAAAHVHNAAAGVDGPVVRTITDDFSGNSASGLWTANDAEPLTDALIQDLLAGNLYINIHTADNAAGELRGQVYPSSGAGLTAALTTAQETHEVESEATGTASVQATDAGVLFFVTVGALSSPLVAAHFHRGPTGENGPVVRTITDDFAGNTAFGLWTANDAEPLTDSLLQDLLTGNLYFNIHTPNNQPGEARGQVLLSGGMGFSAQLNADQETHAVDSEAMGTAAMTLTDAGLVFHLTVEGLSGDIAAAHFHNAAAGADGPVVRTITDDFAGNTASGLWTANDAEPLTDAMIRALLADELYINIHTPDNGPGEIRGQVHFGGDDTDLTATLTAAQETHEVESEGTGTASIQVVGGDVLFFVSVDSLSGEIAAAHFHRAPAGENGPVVRTITGDFVGNTALGLWTASDDEPLTDSLLQDLLMGNLYLNIHTPDNGPGEVRGQISVSAGGDLSALLTPAQETHEVESDAAGTAAMTLTDAGLAFKVTVEGLSGEIAAAHFHRAPAGENGPVVRTISDDFTGITASGLWTANDAEPLTDSLIQDLLTGNLYLNIHTPDNGPGEVRGQVRLGGGIGAAVQLDPGQETHAVTSAAQGTSALTLTDAGLVFDLTVEGLSGDIAAAHVHNAPFGVDGPVVRTITDDFTGNTASGVWRGGDAEPFTVDMTSELLAGNLYINVHTPDNGPGEVRGQIRPNGVVATAIEHVDDQVPEAFTLSQNYPNPFNPVTTIEFSLTRSTHAVLTVYNMLGQKVATLVDGPLAVGQYRVTFDARGLSTGVYYYRLEAGGQARTQKMILLK